MCAKHEQRANDNEDRRCGDHPAKLIGALQPVYMCEKVYRPLIYVIGACSPRLLSEGKLVDIIRTCDLISSMSIIEPLSLSTNTPVWIKGGDHILLRLC